MGLAKGEGTSFMPPEAGVLLAPDVSHADTPGGGEKRQVPAGGGYRPICLAMIIFITSEVPP